MAHAGSGLADAGSQNVRKDVLDAEGGRKPEGQGWPESIPAASTNKQPPPLCGGGFLLVEIGMNQAQKRVHKTSGKTFWAPKAGASPRAKDGPSPFPPPHKDIACRNNQIPFI